MRKEIHPHYNFTVFHDVASGFRFLTRTTRPSQEKTMWTDGNEYPLIKIEISAASHPFFTGEKVLVDHAGRVDRFNKRYAKKSEAD